MPLKVVVELQIHAVTCPGVFLPEKHGVYLSVCVLGQYKETDCLPPIFPLLFHEKMWFEKVFESATDPAAVMEMLESNVTKFGLTQLVPPVGDDLAFYEESTRDFLFPEPKLMPAYPGVDREVLMKTAPGFPGIAPKIEFSTRTTIIELPCQYRKPIRGRSRTRIQRSASVSPTRRSISSTRCKTTKKKDKICKRLTRSLRSHSSSPNTTKLFRENQLQLSRLSLGSAGYKAGPEVRPPFVVRHVDSNNPFGEKNSPELPHRNVKQNMRPLRDSLEFQLKQALSFDNFEASNTSVKVIREPDEQNTSEHDSSSLDADELVNYSHSPTQRDSAFQRTASFATSRHHRSPSPAWSHSPPQHSWERIHERVRSLLTSNQARERLSFGATESEVDEVLERRCISLRSSPQNDLLEQRYC
ncbi:PREDICTED: spermatogenesis associated 6-like protein isoform X1 [Crocodylus porosus]|uniref:Spermatosis associated 6 like n=1 Tax=Crocodylus porosus TaxID=8502 RepID=A0A7M4FTE7_CROPO|nr:PREDICTED: spermatogenesis associated 6-like protein isoform X1 [Crocodylus porosus]XP_019410977.1 PREDICTED: spermatogenesis associated 6-like protein isoform X1 [Crocodylus porosus]